MMHHRHAIADLANDAQVVGDENVSELELLLQLREQIENPGLYRDVECGDGFIRNDQRGRMMSARAMPMRWRCPPEKACG